ncbi:MAG: hypothetical protein KF729_02510 [Sandaracinaceae bacterium]|nr:hypothetical protein [Sandaracinaceae bacterium]
MKSFIEHAMIALYPRTDALPGIEDAGISEFLDRYREESTLLMWLGLIAGAFAFIASPILTVHWPLPSFLLPARVLDEHAHRVTSSQLYLLRQAIFLIKLAAGLCWGAHPAVRAHFAMAPYAPDPGTWRAS